MTGARYESEEWLAWYRELTPTFAELTLAERGALVSIVMVLNPRTGEKPLRRGLSSLPSVLGDGVTWEDLEPALGRLIALGKLEWDGSNFVLKDPEYLVRKRKTSAERTAEWRARKRDAGDTRDVTNVTPSHVTQTRSDQIRQDQTRDPPTGDLGAPPEWFVQTAERVIGDTGERFGIPEAWLSYAGHRRNKMIAMNANDASYWLARVMVPEARRERQAAREREDNRHRRFEPPERPKVPREQAKREAEEFAAKLAARRKVPA